MPIQNNSCSISFLCSVRADVLQTLKTLPEVMYLHFQAVNFKIRFAPQFCF